MRKGKKIKISKQDRIYLFLVYLFLGIFILCVLYPLLYVVSCSFSDPEALVQGIFINGGEVLLGEAVVLYLLGVPLLLFFRRSGLMEKLLHGAHPSPH